MCRNILICDSNYQIHLYASFHLQYVFTVLVCLSHMCVHAHAHVGGYIYLSVKVHISIYTHK